MAEIAGRGIMQRGTFYRLLDQLIMHTFGKSTMRQGILFGNFLHDISAHIMTCSLNQEDVLCKSHVKELFALKFTKR